ncbi:MAG TPA: SDR family NAD(P)-dependent oxidoreductase [Verrucomicrobiae bacterium]|nr:SDR family NAD(P)-dependent oxidoreductase [Verrucomicrobiae bacterium]
MDPAGKVALITGAARIGRVVATSLARRGVDVAIAWRASRDAAEETASEVRALGRKAKTIQADMSDPQAVPRIVDEVGRDLGGPDILVPMASHYQKVNFDDLDDVAWRRNVDADLQGTYRLALRCAVPMRARGGGRIVAFADWLPSSGRPRYKGFLPYYVAKAGVIGLVEALALELAPAILVNAVAPGPILRPEVFSDAEDREVLKATPLGRWGGADEVARAVLFLIETEFVTGETLRVDGGRHLN